MKHSFKDNDAREWSLIVDGRVLSRARRLGEVDVGAVIASVREEGVPDVGQLIDLCFYAAEHNSRIVSGSVDRGTFMRLLWGKCLLPAVDATIAALAECFGMEQQKEDKPSDPPPAAAPDSHGATGGDSLSSPE